MKKKLIFLICILILGNMLYSQDSKGIYFVVEAKNRPESMEPLGLVLKDRYYEKNYSYKDSITIFNAYVNTSNIPVLRLWHFYRIKPKMGEDNINAGDQHKVYIKDSSFLNTVDCVYWEDVRDLSRADFKEYIGPKLKYGKQNGKWEQRTIYIVNMSEKQTDGKLVIYQVEDVVKQWNTGPKIQVGSEREKHVRALYEKVDKRKEQRKEKLSKK